MTYRQLAEWIDSLNTEQKDSDVTIFCEDNDEYYPATNTDFTVESEQSVLNDNHPIICI